METMELQKIFISQSTNKASQLRCYVRGTGKLCSLLHCFLLPANFYCSIPLYILSPLPGYVIPYPPVSGVSLLDYPNEFLIFKYAFIYYANKGHNLKQRYSDPTSLGGKFGNFKLVDISLKIHICFDDFMKRGHLLRFL